MMNNIIKRVVFVILDYFEVEDTANEEKRKSSKTRAPENRRKRSSIVSGKMPPDQAAHSRSLAPKLAKKRKEYQQQLEDEALELINQFEHKLVEKCSKEAWFTINGAKIVLLVMKTGPIFF